jgi:hypothetical protein
VHTFVVVRGYPKGIPAVVINGILKFVGAPSREDLKKTIVEELKA